MYEDSILHDHVRGLERKLRESIPASKADVMEISDRLSKIEQALTTMSAMLALGQITHDGKEVPLAPVVDVRNLVHHH